MTDLIKIFDNTVWNNLNQFQIKRNDLKMIPISLHTPVISCTSAAVTDRFVRKRATLCKNVTALRISPSVHLTNSVIA